MLAQIRWTILFTAILWSAFASADRQPEDDERLIDDPRVQHMSYVSTVTGETIPYALFIPSSYDPDNAASPLIVGLHGLGRSYDWLMGYHGFLDYAEQLGFVIVTPLGYTRRGWYGSRATPDPEDGIHSEEDVMDVIAEVREAYRIDENRIYMFGHSMGGAGTYHIAQKNPYLFAGLAVAAPAPEIDQSPEVLASIQQVPILVLQGTADALVPVEMTRRWVSAMKSLGMQHLYVELEGADHSLFISQNRENMRKVMHFFDITRRRYPAVR
ncbi:MAG: alpha/beta fold hydrolase [Pseudohongiellaceae bacterium]|nr:alpha/beta fold hydrolase [Pseudohongiellaceae bacterium]